MTLTMGGGSSHGAEQRGLMEAAQATGPDQIDRLEFDGRFNRLFPDLPAAVFSLSDLDSLAAKMGARAETNTFETEVDGEENVGTADDPGIPAGYTYFGQFVDHDMTLDAVSLSMKQEDVSAVENFRTPALDLDCLYGRGPDDQPYMYDPTGRQLLLGDRPLTEGVNGRKLGVDLVRIKGRAVIGDKRNDENVIVSQLQGLFIRFHNQLAASDKLKDSSFDDVRRQVQWTYQWLVLWDYLPRIVGRDLVQSILPPGTHQPDLKFFKPRNTAFIPVEFAGAAYRYGHSMVRPIYRLNLADDVGGPEGDLGRRLIFAPQGTHSGLNGFQEFDAKLGINWALFFETGTKTLFSTRSDGKQRIQPAYKIDTSLVFPTTRLPEFSDESGKPLVVGGAEAINVLAQRNLRRGMMLGLPSGQAVARQMGIPVIADKDLIIDKAQAESFDEPAADKPPLARLADGRPTMRDSAPLWAYVLAESRYEWGKRVNAALEVPENKNKTGDARSAVINAVPARLGATGARIVAETLIGLVAADPRSVLNEGRSRGFSPLPGDASKTGFERLTMGDLVRFVQPQVAE